MNARSRDTKLLRRVAAHGGVHRTSTLLREGFSDHDLRKAVSVGALLRVRKGWVAARSADPQLVGAARAGVVLTCVTQARRLGLWTIDDGRAHVGAPPHAGGVRTSGETVHWSRAAVPRHPDSLADPVENVLALAAECQPHDHALAIWESALNKGLVSLESLRRLPLRPAARSIREQVRPWADSGLESFVPRRLRWLRLPIVPQAWIAGHRVDFLIGDRLVLQIDGGTHVGPQRDSDNRHDAVLALMGYHVIRVGYDQVVNRWHEVQDLIMRAVAQGMHLAM